MSESTLDQPQPVADATGIDTLEQKRFVITPSSMENMKRIRNILPSLQRVYPYLSGIAFFGSRTKGKERPDSDIDVRMLYDKSKLDDPEEESYGFREIKTHLSLATGLTMDSHGWAYDISEKATREDIKSFSEYVDYIGEHQGTEEQTINQLLENPLTQRLSSRFLLAVGDGVYKNRQFVLDQFKQIPNGEFYFQMLMKSMASFERGNNPKAKYQTPKFEGYPKTIAEAEKYFLRTPIFTDKQDPVAAT